MAGVNDCKLLMTSKLTGSNPAEDRIAVYYTAINVLINFLSKNIFFMVIPYQGLHCCFSLQCITGIGKTTKKQTNKQKINEINYG
jgi:hypothetical protein